MESDQVKSTAQVVAEVLQDICKDDPTLLSVTVSFNWVPALINDLPPGAIVTTAGDVSSVPSDEIIAMMNQWHKLHSKLARMLAASTEQEQMKLLDAATTLRHVEALHDKARTTENVTTPFREILRVASAEGPGNAIAYFEEWFCTIPGGGSTEGNEEEGEAEEKTAGRGEADGGGSGGSEHPPPIL